MEEFICHGTVISLFQLSCISFTSNKQSDIKIHTLIVFGENQKFQIALVHKCYRSEYSLDGL